jgi:hypothetical protein
VSRDVQSERQAHQQLEGNPAKFDQQIGEKESAAEVRTRTIRRRNGGNKEMTGKHAPTRFQGLHQLRDEKYQLRVEKQQLRDKENILQQDATSGAVRL